MSALNGALRRRGALFGPAVVASAVLLGTAACGALPSGGSGATPAAKLSALQAAELASKNATPAGSAHVTLALTVDVGGLPMFAHAGKGGSMSVSVNATGDQDYGNRTADYSVTFGGILAALMGPSPSAQLILAGKTAYVSSPILQKFGITKQWVSVPLAGKVGKLVLDVVFTDPSRILTTLEGVGSVSAAGTKTIGGVPVTGYTVNVDVTKVIAALHLPAKVSKLAGCLHLPTFPVTVWIDSAGRARQIAVSWDLAKMLSGVISHFAKDPAAASKFTATLDLTINLSNFGEKLHITAPPASDVQAIPWLAHAGSHHWAGDRGAWAHHRHHRNGSLKACGAS